VDEAAEANCAHRADLSDFDDDLTPDEMRGAAGPICPTCAELENPICSNPYHLPREPKG
jgi:hypothetical protein